MKSLLLDKSLFTQMIRSCKLNDMVYFKVKDRALVSRNIDFKTGSGLLDQLLTLDQEVSFATPYYFSMDVTILLKALKTLKGPKVIINLNQKEGLYEISAQGSNDSNHYFKDRFEFNNSNIEVRIDKKLVEPKDQFLSLRLPLNKFNQILESAEAINSSVSFTIEKDNLKVISSRVDGKSFSYQGKISETDMCLKKRVNFGKFAKTILNTELDYCELKFFKDFLVIKIDQASLKKELYIPFKN